MPHAACCGPDEIWGRRAGGASYPVSGSIDATPIGGMNGRGWWGYPGHLSFSLVVTMSQVSPRPFQVSFQETAMPLLLKCGLKHARFRCRAKRSQPHTGPAGRVPETGSAAGVSRVCPPGESGRESGWGQRPLPQRFEGPVLVSGTQDGHRERRNASLPDSRKSIGGRRRSGRDTPAHARRFESAAGSDTLIEAARRLAGQAGAVSFVDIA